MQASEMMEAVQVSPHASSSGHPWKGKLSSKSSLHAEHDPELALVLLLFTETLSASTMRRAICPSSLDVLQSATGCETTFQYRVAAVPTVETSADSACTHDSESTAALESAASGDGDSPACLWSFDFSTNSVASQVAEQAKIASKTTRKVMEVIMTRRDHGFALMS